MLALALPAPAQGLRALHVDALAMRTDHAQVHVGEVFHLAIHAHVRERLAALDELVVPNVGTMLLEGDERHVTAAANGTDVTETLTLEPTVAGTFTFNPAYLDAIDARTGKPMRFSTNSVRVVVQPPGPTSASAGAVLALIAAWIVIPLVALAALAMGIVALVSARRRPAPPVAAPAVPPATIPPPRTPRDEVADALRGYQHAPATGSLIRLRGALFAAAGVAAGATLRDALLATADPTLRAALAAAERTAFGPASLRDASSLELIDGVRAWLR